MSGFEARTVADHDARKRTLLEQLLGPHAAAGNSEVPQSPSDDARREPR